MVSSIGCIAILDRNFASKRIARGGQSVDSAQVVSGSQSLNLQWTFAMAGAMACTSLAGLESGSAVYWQDSIHRVADQRRLDLQWCAEQIGGQALIGGWWPSGIGVLSGFAEMPQSTSLTSEAKKLSCPGRWAGLCFRFRLSAGTDPRPNRIDQER